MVIVIMVMVVMVVMMMMMVVVMVMVVMVVIVVVMVVMVVVCLVRDVMDGCLVWKVLVRHTSSQVGSPFRGQENASCSINFVLSEAVSERPPKSRMLTKFWMSNSMWNN